MTDRTFQLSPRLPWIALAVVLGFQCVLGATQSMSSQIADSNTANLVQIARICLEAPDCTSKGGEGRLGIFNGASWIRLLSYSLRTRGNLRVAQSVVLDLLILSAAITFFVILRYYGLRAAALALGLYLPLILAGADFRSLDNPNLYPFPLAVCYAAMLLFTELRRAVLALLASAALALAASAYVLLLIFVPFHFALVALWARRPVWTSAGAVLA